MNVARDQGGLGVDLGAPVATITLQRPEKLNAITPAMLVEQIAASAAAKDIL